MELRNNLRKHAWKAGVLLGTGNFLNEVTGCSTPFPAETSGEIGNAFFTSFMLGLICYGVCKILGTKNVAKHTASFFRDMKDYALTAIYRKTGSLGHAHDALQRIRTRNPHSEIPLIELAGIAGRKAFYHHELHEEALIDEIHYYLEADACRRKRKGLPRKRVRDFLFVLGAQSTLEDHLPDERDHASLIEVAMHAHFLGRTHEKEKYFEQLREISKPTFPQQYALAMLAATFHLEGKEHWQLAAQHFPQETTFLKDDQSVEQLTIGESNFVLKHGTQEKIEQQLQHFRTAQRILQHLPRVHVATPLYAFTNYPQTQAPVLLTRYEHGATLAELDQQGTLKLEHLLDAATFIGEMHSQFPRENILEYDYARLSERNLGNLKPIIEEHYSPITRVLKRTYPVPLFDCHGSNFVSHATGITLVDLEVQGIGSFGIDLALMLGMVQQRSPEEEWKFLDRYRMQFKVNTGMQFEEEELRKTLSYGFIHAALALTSSNRALSQMQKTSALNILTRAGAELEELTRNDSENIIHYAALRHGIEDYKKDL